jgi:hypothetical protein
MSTSHSWRAHAGRIQPFFLPAYTPHLNLMKRFWRYLKDKLACHHWWNDLERPQLATRTQLIGLEVHLHATDGPAFRPVQDCRTSAWSLGKKSTTIPQQTGVTTSPQVFTA